MKIVAMVCLRNGDLYLHRCLDHLAAQGVEACIIDNDSTDTSLAIAESFRGRGVVHIEHLPFDGVFRFTDILRRKEQLARELEADWLMHYDVDEIREAPRPWNTPPWAPLPAAPPVLRKPQPAESLRPECRGSARSCATTASANPSSPF